jgi:hypothetical protein
MKSLKSGDSYKLTDLFKDNRHIIIPDLQRDYCWGDYKDEKGKPSELVSGFIDSLNAIFEDKREIKLGMIYAYEYPKDSNRIYLCDGQQRITTLYLLLGMINRHIENEEIKNFLISDFELTDDQEPRLQYAIRESTLYFISDLVCKFFLENKNLKISEIKKQSWYFNEYDLDPSIQSMISAMGIIETKLLVFNNLKEFANFLLNHIEFFYFDMKIRETGEDMFVVINTTGEPLTATENIKPILIGNIENPEDRKTASDLWEKWEKWFWNNKSESEHEADQGLNTFFIYYWQIKLLQERQWKNKNSFPLNPMQLFTQNSEIESNEESDSTILLEELNKAKSIDEIEKYFLAYQNLFEDIKKNENQSVLNSIKPLAFEKADCLRELPINVVLPLIQFKIKYPAELINPFLRRLRKNYFDGHKDWKERKDNYINWRHLIQLIDKSTSIENLFCFSDNSNFKNISGIPNNNIENWYNTEEQLKEKLKKENSLLIESIEDHQDFMGDISFFLFEVHKSEIKINCLFLETYFKNYINTIDRIRSQDGKKPLLVNYIRLLLLLNNCNKVAHIERSSWSLEGVSFSSIQNRFHLKKTDFKKLCSMQNDEELLIEYCKERILVKINKDEIFDLLIFTTEKFIKSWLILKVANAEKGNHCLAFYDGNETGVAAYLNKDHNRLLETEEFSLGNSICGFAVKSGRGGEGRVDYTYNELWLKPDIIDSPFADIAFEKEKRIQEQIQLNGKKIDELKKLIFNWKNLIPA